MWVCVSVCYILFSVDDNDWNKYRYDRILRVLGVMVTPKNRTTPNLQKLKRQGLGLMMPRSLYYSFMMPNLTTYNYEPFISLVFDCQHWWKLVGWLIHAVSWLVGYPKLLGYSRPLKQVPSYTIKIMCSIFSIYGSHCISILMGYYVDALIGLVEMQSKLFIIFLCQPMSVHECWQQWKVNQNFAEEYIRIMGCFQ